MLFRSNDPTPQFGGWGFLEANFTAFPGIVIAITSAIMVPVDMAAQRSVLTLQCLVEVLAIFVPTFCKACCEGPVGTVVRGPYACSPLAGADLDEMKVL